MANEKKNTEVATTGNQTPANQESQQYTPIQQGGGIDYGNVVQADTDDMDALLDAFQSAKAAPLNANRETWNPSEAGETKLLMFLTYDMLDVEFKNKQSTVPYVVFAEPRADKEGRAFIAQIMTGRSQLVHFFLAIDRETRLIKGAKQPQKSLWEITYVGTKGTANGNTMHNYLIKPATVA